MAKGGGLNEFNCGILDERIGEIKLGKGDTDEICIVQLTSKGRMLICINIYVSARQQVNWDNLEQVLADPLYYLPSVDLIIYRDFNAY